MPTQAFALCCRPWQYDRNKVKTTIFSKLLSSTTDHARWSLMGNLSQHSKHGHGWEACLTQKKNKELEVNSIVRIHFSLGSKIERANWDNKENRTSENQIVVSELDYYHTKRNNLVLRRMNLVVDQRKGARSVFSFYYFSVFLYVVLLLDLGKLEK